MGLEGFIAVLISLAMFNLIATCWAFIRNWDVHRELTLTIRGLGDEATQRRMTALEVECKTANESRAELGAAVISMLERHPELPNDEDVKRLKDLVHFVD